jgi:hypothetical protein
MRSLSLALTILAISAIPVGAYADQQSTSAQSDLKASVKARQPTHKRQQIIRSESNQQTTGAAPSHSPR